MHVLCFIECKWSTLNEGKLPTAWFSGLPGLLLVSLFVWKHCVGFAQQTFIKEVFVLWQHHFACLELPRQQPSYSIHSFWFLSWFNKHACDFWLRNNLSCYFFKFLSFAHILYQLLRRIVWWGFYGWADVWVDHLLWALFFAAFLWAAIFLRILLFFNRTKPSLIIFLLLLNLTRSFIFSRRLRRIFEHFKHRNE